MVTSLAHSADEFLCAPLALRSSTGNMPSTIHLFGCFFSGRAHYYCLLSLAFSFGRTKPSNQFALSRRCSNPERVCHAGFLGCFTQRYVKRHEPGRLLRPDSGVPGYGPAGNIGRMRVTAQPIPIATSD